MDTPNERNLALFIDFDNIAIGLRESRKNGFEIRLVLDRLLEKGRIIAKKAYADWKYYDRYKAALHSHNIELIDIPKRSVTGKNSADIRLVVDALDLCHTNPHINTFAIISGDSDFSPLVSKLRENNKLVVGIGMKDSTSMLLVENCDEFLYYEDLSEPEKEPERQAGAPKVPKEKAAAFRAVVQAVNALIREGHEILYASLVKDTIKRKNPSFNESSWNYANFGELLEDAMKFDVLEANRDRARGGTWVITKLKGL
ncbi:MAG: NYN domain-containing protein [Calditrichaeota bacterium]|nr:NYN domain-containing protein [Candidatus Cloacimonadota bacterium]MCB1046848.1 NYN domain-containing protein [Calditrichota bacterium]MCB9474411.1 NYN domain-containing protein [Candidatus Delongbacteria bacterium]